MRKKDQKKNRDLEKNKENLEKKDQEKNEESLEKKDGKKKLSKKAKRIIIIVVAIVAALIIACGVLVIVSGGFSNAFSTVKGWFGIETIDNSGGTYSASNDSLVTEELGDITYDRYVLWENTIDSDDGTGVYYISSSGSTYLTIYTEEVSEDALETLTGDDALSYEDVYDILADNIESGYSNVTESSREMTTVGGSTDAMTLKFYTDYDSDDTDATPYEHWITYFLYNGNLYYFILAEPQEVTVEIEYNIVITSIICM